MSSLRGVPLPAAKPPEFRRRAVHLARSGHHPVAKVASDLGISESRTRTVRAGLAHATRATDGRCHGSLLRRRDRALPPRGEKGPLTCDFTCSGGRI